MATRAVMRLPDLLEHGRAELQAAEQMLAQHQPAGNGCCSCGRGLPCRDARIWESYRRYWTARLAWLADEQPVGAGR